MQNLSKSRLRSEYSLHISCRTIIEQTVARVLVEGNASRFAKRFGGLFPISDNFDTFEFSQVHKIVLGLLPVSIDIIASSPNLRLEINLGDIEGKTPLYWAARRGDSHAVKRLILAGANVNAADRGADTPLAAAARSSSIKCVEVLIAAGAKIDSKDCFGYTALANSCKMHKDPAFIRGLIEAGANANSTDKHGATPFARSARYNSPRIGEYLLQKGRADMNWCDFDGNPPLFEAIMKNNVEFLEMLLSNGVQTDIVNHAGWNILHVIATFGDAATIRCFENTHLHLPSFLTKDATGKTPMQCFDERIGASAKAREAMHNLIQSRMNKLKYFEARGDHTAEDGEEDVFCDALENQVVPEPMSLSLTHSSFVRLDYNRRTL